MMVASPKDFLFGMAIMFLYMLLGIFALMLKCTDANGKGKAEVKDIILWQYLWPLPTMVAIARGIINTGRRMLDSLPKSNKKEGERK